MITANVWEKVVHIECGPWVGTGFTINRQGQQYVVTARHLVETGDAVKLRVRGAVVTVDLEVIEVPVADADVAVFRTDHPITPDLPLEATADRMVYGQDAYFLGFPLGLAFDISPTETFPLVKRATISGTNHHINGRPVLLLDGWNNPGFSGGPVVFRPRTQFRLQEPLRVCGLIASYWPEPGEVTMQGARVSTIETVMNSGVVIAEEIARVLEAIESTGTR